MFCGIKPMPLKKRQNWSQKLLGIIIGN